MGRVCVFALVAFALPAGIQGQALVVLQVRAAVADASGRPEPLARHALLVSDEPQTRETRRMVTGADGTAEIRVRPGTYVVESDQPVAIAGTSYRWRQMVTIAAGSAPVLDLTVDNAVIEPVGPEARDDTAAAADDPGLVENRWLDSVVELWTPTAHASGFLVDPSGLIATNQRVVGEATSVEVQISRSLKVAGRVLAADTQRDVAIVRIDPSVMPAVSAVPLACPVGAATSLAPEHEIFTVAAPLRQRKSWTPGTVVRSNAQTIAADIPLAAGGTGGPVFTSSGELVGLTSPSDVDDPSGGETRIVGVGSLCDVVEAAAAKVTDAPAPSAAPLPVEPLDPAPVAVFKEAVKRRAGSLTPYRMTASDFDVSFITPILAFAAQSRPDGSFANWTDYVADIPQVLFVRVTPKMTESFWARLARGAAYTQGMALPAIKRLKTGFERMEAFCGDAPVTPIHPFKLELRVSETEVVHEGLYAFAPDALGPECSPLTLVLYSEKAPTQADRRVVDAALLQQVRRDFEVGRTP